MVLAGLVAPGGGHRGGVEAGGGGPRRLRRRRREQRQALQPSSASQVQNLFNVVDRSRRRTERCTSPQLWQSTQLAGGIFTSDSAVRRVFLQASFSF